MTPTLPDEPTDALNGREDPEVYEERVCKDEARTQVLHYMGWISSRKDWSYFTYVQEQTALPVSWMQILQRKFKNDDSLSLLFLDLSALLHIRTFESKTLHRNVPMAKEKTGKKEATKEDIAARIAELTKK